ncbi:hypothetical protein RDWZM_001976 [Blomia tropicalis]|uniref:Ammonium transporter AmtB-like domain-containing protein n=1 Tax=Blomia tropicalis TaxID=40697 RepID=A0A9Q0RR58_BLOTA|nr:hypothetical protein RDWZM_001976 [Blomia tropicalis]
MTKSNNQQDYMSVKINGNDATWILTSSFIIFTMQTGFSLLQSGMVRRKNQISIMIMNMFNPIVSGLTYWFIAYGFTETSSSSNEFIGLSNFMTDSIEPNMGQLFASYTYKLSTMSTATNVVLGAMAERINFIPYLIYSVGITIAFSIPSYWVSSPRGFLHKLGTVDVAGCSFIHLAGGTAGLVATILLKPRIGRFQPPYESYGMSDPTNSLLGTYMLWWGWVGFHMSSTFGVSNGRWNYCTRSAVCSIISSSIGGFTAILFSYVFHNRQINIKIFVCGLFSGMVAVSGGCTLFNPQQALLVGFIGSLCSMATMPILKKLQIDDPTQTIAIHAISSIWGMLSIGLMISRNTLFNATHSGLFQSGSFHLFGSQIAAILAVGIWSAMMSYLILKGIMVLLPIRIDKELEEVGIDLSLNNINTDLDWDKILMPNPGPTFTSSTTRRKTRQKLMKVVNAMIAVQRLIQLSSKNRFRRHIKAYNTKVLAQSWSAVQPLVTSARVRPAHTEPHA